MSDTKEQIKNRMVKNAATLWGVPANEIEMSFDPLVMLLLSACASEIEKISDKINESQVRVTEKIIQLMTPETIFGPKPSHSIAYSFPLEPEVEITPEYLFSFKKKETERARSIFREIFFSPIQKFKLVKAEIKYLVFANNICGISASKEKEVLFKANKKIVPESVLYLGINTEQEGIAFKDASIYFDLQDFEVTKLFYHHLQNAKWYVNDKEIKTQPGFFKDDVQDSESINAILNEDSLKISNIVEQTLNNYKRYYVTIKENFNTKKELPNEIEQIIQQQRIKIDENTTWLKIVFPRVINSNILENLHCSLNTFPIINRKLNEFSYQLKEYINIVPISTTNLFLDIKSITNLNNRKYSLLNKSVSGNEKGIYSIKTGDISKIDNRKAKEYVSHLIGLLKDESASFSYMNNSFLHTNLKKLNQIISQLEEKVSSSDTEEVRMSYISVNPYRPKDMLTIEFWSTDGKFANNIKYGSSLKNYKTVGLKQKSSFLVTSTYGGRDELSMNERLYAYRRTLLSRDKVVTKEDIKLACFEFFGEKIEDVEVKNGYTVDLSLNKGMVNCIEIHLASSKAISTDNLEWDFIQNNLLLYLEKNSTSVFPFVIKKVR